MQPNSQIAAVDTEFFAKFIAVALFEKNTPEQSAVRLRELSQGFFYNSLALFRDQLGLGTPPVIGWLRGIRGNLQGSGFRPVTLMHHMLTDGVDEPAEALRMKNGAWAAQRGEHPKKGFLAGFRSQLRRPETLPEFNQKKLSKIGDEMRLDFRVALSQTVEIFLVKCPTFHGTPTRFHCYRVRSSRKCFSSCRHFFHPSRYYAKSLRLS